MRNLAVACMTLFLLVGTVLADEEAAQKVLADKGLVLRGNVYVLPAELDLSKSTAALNRAKAAFRKAQNDHRAMERKIAQAKAYIADRQFRLEQLMGETRKAQNARDYNKLVEEINALEAELKNITAQREQAEKENQTNYDKAQAEFVNVVLEISEKLDETAKQYDALNNDEAVKAALATLSQDNRRFIIGPTNAFENARRMIGRETEHIQSGVIKLHREANTFLVDVRLNEKPTRQMVLDTGASSISLPFDMANELGLTVTDEDQKVQVQLADGRIVLAAAKILDSVQVGQFIVKNVECLVLPEELVAAPALLGNSFLKHFQFRLDPEAGELSMVRIESDGDKPAARPAAGGARN